ncbi:GGDEF domain-containing protein [Roseateles saccharophilus]|nr:GGDEF domain-containing protein [Roseateles saccharophilus]
MQRLLEANEQLVIDALRSRDMAESTALLMAELSRNSELDSLTQLPNRLLLVDRFSQGLTHARRHDGRLALLFLDLDGFKEINDKLGHRVGDEVLRAVSLCLVSCVRQIDTVCRLGGDEFVVLLPEIADATDPGLVAQKLMEALEALTHEGRLPIRVSASIGISVYPDDAQDIEALVDCADQAMYRSKRAGGRRYSFFATRDAGPGQP